VELKIIEMITMNLVIFGEIFMIFGQVELLKYIQRRWNKLNELIKG
jgi:hypothetical protein